MSDQASIGGAIPQDAQVGSAIPQGAQVGSTIPTGAQVGAAIPADASIGDQTPTTPSTQPQPGMLDPHAETDWKSRGLNFLRGGVNSLVAPIIHPINTVQGTIQQYRDFLPSYTMVNGVPVPVPNREGMQHLMQQSQEATEHPFYTAGSLIAPVVAGEAVGGALRATGRAIGRTGGVAEGLVDTTEAANQKALETATAKNQAAVERAAEQNAKLAEKHALKTKNVQAQNEAAQSDFEAAQAAHNDAVAKANEVNQAAAQDQTNRGVLARQLQQTSARLVNRVKSIAANTKANLDQSYADIGTATEGKTVPLSDLSDAVTAARSKLKGSTENIKIFNDIMARQPEVDAETGEIQETPTHPLYQAIQNAAKAAGEELPEGVEAPPTPSTDIAFRDLRGYYSELGEKLAGGNLPPDVYQAMRSLQTRIGQMAQEIATDSGVGAKYRMTQNHYRDYMQTFRESAGPNHSGSPIAQSLDAADPSYAIKPLTDPATAARVRNMLSRFDPAVNGVGGAGQLYDNFRNISSQYEQSGKLKPTTVPTNAPEAPTPKPLPQAPTPIAAKTVQPNIKQIGPQDIQAAKAAAVTGRGQKLTGEAPRVVSSMAGFEAARDFFRGHFGMMGLDLAARGLYGATRSLKGQILQTPAVVEFLSRPTASDLAELQRLPESQRTLTNERLGELIREAKARGIPVAPQLAAMVGLSANQQESQKQFATQNMPDTGDSAGLNVLPDALQRIAGNVKIVRDGSAVDSSGRPAIASVDNGSGNTIAIHDPSRMTAPVLAHELWHLGENNMAPTVRSSLGQDAATAYMGPNDLYKLADMRKQGASMRTIGPENRAQIMQAYAQYYNNPEMRSILQPWVDEGNEMLQNQSNILPTPMDANQLVTTPRAPVPPRSAFAPK